MTWVESLANPVFSQTLCFQQFGDAMSTARMAIIMQLFNNATRAVTTTMLVKDHAYQEE